MLSQALSFQHYNLKNYNTGLFTFGDGESNNFSYTIGLPTITNDPIYPIEVHRFLCQQNLVTLFIIQ